MQSLRVRLTRHHFSYDIQIGRGLRHQVCEQLQSSLGDQRRRIVVISNKKVFSLYGAELDRALRRNDYKPLHWFLPDGERFKTLRYLEKAVLFLAENDLERSDVVIALGGGVVGDLAGFAAATYMRGIPFVQMPTSLLAQIDSSVGGKTGVNLPSGKNLAGAFHQPSLVIIDTETLITLPRRELVSGFCEAVKQAAIAGKTLFNQTVKFLRNRRAQPNALLSGEMESFVAAHCAFKARVVAGDERESINRLDRRSRKILNFGHTTAHALETVTAYRRFRHGEAVGYGVLVAAHISKNLGLLDPAELESLVEAVRLCGPLPRAADLDRAAIIKALAHDKKRISGQIKWVLLEGIGRPLIVPGKEIGRRLLQLALREGLGDKKE